MLRFFDIVFSLLGLLFLSPLLIILFILGYFDTGSPIFKQERIGRFESRFCLVKFRTMKPDTASVATHEADPSAVTRYGSFLRKTKLDELPQLFNVLQGKMSLVGPRPGLPNQYELTKERKKLDVYKVRPGITGLAQVKKIDMSNPQLLAVVDWNMINDLGVVSYFKYIFFTLIGNGGGDRVKTSTK